MYKTWSLAIFIASICCGSACAQDKKTENTLTAGANFKPQPVSVESLDWLAGHWNASALGGQCEEIWSPAVGNEMIGMFRLIKDEKPIFYEFMTITPTQDSLTLRIKHFDPALKTWEAQDEFTEFKFVQKVDSTMYFDGLTFAPKDDDHLTIFVANEQDGKYSELRFDFTRVKPALSQAAKPVSK
jgi:hypothetical protein